MLLKLKDILSHRWTPRKKLNLEPKERTVNCFKIVFYNLRCLLIKDIVGFRDRILVAC
jgi:hypothetical protein